MDKLIKVSPEVYNALYLQAEKGVSFDALLRRMLNMAPRRQSLPKQARSSRQKYPILDMAIGDEITMPWIRDPETGQPIEGAMRGLNACIARCNRIAGRKYRSFATTSGLRIARLS
jgi:hypothetical protein